MSQFFALVWPRLTRLGEVRPTFVLSRFALAGLTFLTTFYCLLFYVPFSRHTLFDWHVVGALDVLASYYSLLYWSVLSLVSWTLISYLRKPGLRRLTIAFLLVSTAAGICVWFRPLLPNLPPDERSLIWSLISLFPLWWIAILDWRATQPNEKSLLKQERNLGFVDVLAIAAGVSILYLGIFAIRYLVKGAASFTISELLVFALSSFAWHLALFALIFSAFKLPDAIAARFSKSTKLSLLLRSALVSLALFLVLRKVVFAAISFNDRLADVSAFALSLSFVAFFASSLFRVRSFNAVPGHRLLFREGGRFAPQLGRLAPLLCLSVAGIFAYVTLVNLQGVDWNGLFQKMSVLVVWIAIFVAYRNLRRAPRSSYSLVRTSAIFLASFSIYFTAQTAKPALTRALNRHAPATMVLLERYADYDPSFGITREILAPSAVDVFEGSAEDPFFAMLRQNSNIPPEIRVDPVEVKIVDRLEPTKARKPHIFVFVIDSLRQDYLSPYNQAVQFTPAIDNFARESVVMKNAFTRYGGTGLAEPSIWTGGMQLHKQSMQPFYPMNSLQKLLDVDGYQALVTMDPVLKSLLRPSANVRELDHGVDWKDYDLVRTLAELQSKLATSPPGEQSIFVYSQAQNIHLVSLKVNQRQPVPSQRYEGFERQHAFEVERMDKAFGEFVQFLKSSGLYDESIIVLTADHGDSLGEDGHWGHGNSIYPEVIRIPLIVHLPSQLQKTLAWDTNGVAFSTDITPSLYYLLGHRPVLNNVLTGRPLFTTSLAEQEAYKRDSYLIVDSYGPVYGLLRENGTSLFVADAGRNRAYVYDLKRGYGGQRVNLSEESTAEYERLIARDVQAIQSFYKFQPPSQAPPAPSQPNAIAQLYSLLFSR